MMLPSYASAEEPWEAKIPDSVVAGKKVPEQIAAAIGSVLDSEHRSKVDVTPGSNRSYRVHVRAQIDQFATCHGRYDHLDLTGTAKVVDGWIDVELAGPDRIAEDVCNPSGRGRDIVARRVATASLRIAKRCAGP